MERAAHNMARPGQPASTGDSAGLPALRADFPNYRIWQEILGDRVRYVARRLAPSPGPHTVVAADLGEIRTILAASSRPPHPAPAQPAATTAPNVARIYDVWLGGKDNFDADRQAANAVKAEFPEIVAVARANRQFVIRAVTHVAAQGIRQFIDIGPGLPSSPAVHEIAQRADPACRVAYVDHDPVVLAHARAVLASGPGVSVVPGDLRQADAILASPELRATIDLDQPVCVILAAVLHFVRPREADAAVAAFTAAMAPGSYLIASAGTTTGTSPDLINRLTNAHAGSATVTGRTDTDIAAYFTGLHVEPPGIVDVWAWRPDSQWYWPPPPTARIIGAVARKPASPGKPAAHQPSRQARGTGKPA